MEQESESPHWTKPHICACCVHYQAEDAAIVGVCNANIQRTVTGMHWYPKVEASNEACDKFQLRKEQQ